MYRPDLRAVLVLAQHSSLSKCCHWFYPHTIHHHLKMQMVSCGIAGATDVTDNLTGCDGFACAHGGFGHVSIAGGKPRAVIQQYLIAISRSKRS